MRYLCVYKPGKPEGTPPAPQHVEDMGKFIEESFRSGVLLSTEGCLPSALGARVRLAGGNYTVTDGPFSEAKELIGGFALIQTASKQEAVEIAKRFLQVAGEGETEIRQLYEAPPAPAKS